MSASIVKAQVSFAAHQCKQVQEDTASGAAATLPPVNAGLVDALFQSAGKEPLDRKAA